MRISDQDRVQYMRVEPNTRSDVVYEKLKKAILLGHIPAGAALIEREIVDLMGVSRTPIRSACQRLAYDGLVETRSYRGAAVRDLKATEAQEAYEVRSALEGKAVQLAVARASDEDLMALWDTYIAPGSEESWSSDEESLKRQDLHLSIATLGGNGDLCRKIEHQLNLVALWRNKASRNGVIYRNTKDEHEAILKALLARNAEEARARIEIHIERSWMNSIEVAKGETTWVSSKGRLSSAS